MNEKLLYLIKYLLNENPRYRDIQIPDNETDRFNLYRSLVNIRAASDADAEYLKTEDALLKEISKEKGVLPVLSTAGSFSGRGISPPCAAMQS